MNEQKKNLVCWAVSDGRAGIEANCLGLATAMGIDPIIHHVQMKAPWKWLPPKLIPLHPGIYDEALQSESNWPDIVIGCGRQAALFGALIKNLSRGKSFCIQIQDPKVSPELYDFVVTPQHDRLRGPNVLTTVGSLNKITSRLLEQGASEITSQTEDLPKPLIALLVGGKSKAYDLSEDTLRRLGENLQKLHRETGCGFLVTTSRRTGSENEALLKKYLKDLPSFIWDGKGPNPYFGFLGSADAIIVTSDSVNMVTEAASTGKPVFTVDLEGGNKKFGRFHRQLKELGIIRTFEGRMEKWTYPVLSESQRIAEILLKKIKERDHS